MARLEFPKTEMQIYGGAPSSLITTYIYEIEMDGKRATQSGRGTEIFVRRGNELATPAGTSIPGNRNPDVTF